MCVLVGRRNDVQASVWVGWWGGLPVSFSLLCEPLFALLDVFVE